MPTTAVQGTHRMSSSPERQSAPEGTVVLDVPARVLIVDDDPVIRAMLRETLESSGHQVAEAGDGLQALDEFTRQRPEIVLMDVAMPTLDGISACQQLRRLETGKMTPVLMVTGLEDTDSINAAYQAGATDFISKPINWPVLAQRVRYMLRASRTVRALEVSESRNRAMLETIPDTICLLRADGHIISVPGHGNEEDIWPPRRAVGKHLQDLVPVDIGREISAKLDATLHTGSMQTLEFNAGDKTRPCWREIRLVQYGDNNVLAMASDITERVTASATVHRLAYYDALTGLPNRANFLRRLNRAITVAAENDSQLALLFIDLDFFKRINDNFGHSAGDVVLRAAAGRLAGCVRTTERSDAEETDEQTVLARVGGDEFVILASNVADEDEVERLAERVREALANSFAYQGREFVVTPSLGIAVYPRDGTDAETLLKNADTAMYQAKSGGRNTHRFYSETMSLRSMERLDLELHLRRAVENGDLVLHYQPKVDIQRMRVTGAEALLRWTHPERGPISPEKFIPLAEETGLIGPITDWVLQRACEQALEWSQVCRRQLAIAVNISSNHFTFGNLTNDVWSALCASNLPADRLELEITENLFLKDVATVRDTLGELREMGVSLAVDDFGTGYSSLAYLKRLNLDTLKVDRSFVKDVTTDADDRAICAAIVAIGHNLGLKVIAEGVETEEHLAAMREFGCDLAQGFLFSKAIPAEQIPDFVTAIESPDGPDGRQSGNNARRRTAS